MSDQIKPENAPKQFEVGYTSPEIRRGVYANHLIVQSTPFEFQLNFVYFAPPLPGANEKTGAEVVAKINMPIGIIPGVIRALDESFKKYRERMIESEKESEKPNE